MSLEAPPPSRHISSTPITLTSASRLLETYLANSERHPHLHPDALITPTGVTFSSHGGPTGGVVMHNLRRVAAGLRGEYLEPERTPEPEEDQDAVTEGLDSGRKSRKDRKGGKGGNKEKSTKDDEWQDMAEYEREEGVVEVGDIGTRTSIVQEGGKESEVQATGDAQDGKRKRATVDSEAVAQLSKEARKKAKKERNQQWKRDHEKKRAGKAE
ncbi:Nn.00g100510.m01.CDS01 [Neocucurbitaria sp. VM-36]